MDCPFCLRIIEQESSSDDHVIPKVLGGKITTPVCKLCNDALGHSIESEIMKCPFFTIGMNKLGLKSTKDAYKGLTRNLPNSNIPVHFDTHGAPFVPIGHPAAKYNPIIPRVALSGSVSFPTPILAKIVIDVLECLDYPDKSLRRALATTLFQINKIDKGGTSKHEIVVEPTFFRRAYSHNWERLLSRHDFQSLSYKPYHLLDVNVTQTGIVFISISFFGVVGFVIACMQCEQKNPERIYADSYFVLPITTKGEAPRIERVVVDERHRDRRHLETGMALAGWHLYKNGSFEGITRLSYKRRLGGPPVLTGGVQ